MKTFLDRVFGKAEEINGGERCPTYLYRWVLLRLWGRGVYLHHFVGDDWSRDLHDHPKRFISIGLRGWYEEYTPCSCGRMDCTDFSVKRWTAPWFRSFPAEHIHRITTPSRSCWTLVIVGKSSRPWGFWHRGQFIGWRSYVDGQDGIADKMKACD